MAAQSLFVIVRPTPQRLMFDDGTPIARLYLSIWDLVLFGQFGARAGKDATGGILGFVQVAWNHRCWASYRGAEPQDGSQVADWLAPSIRTQKVWRDSLQADSIFTYPPERLTPVAGHGKLPAQARLLGGRQSPATTGVGFEDQPSRPFDIVRLNRLTNKENFLAECFWQEMFVTVLGVKPDAGEFQPIQHVTWALSHHYKTSGTLSKDGSARGATAIETVEKDTWCRIGAVTDGPPRNPMLAAAMTAPQERTLVSFENSLRYIPALVTPDLQALDRLPQPQPFGEFQ